MPAAPPELTATADASISSRADQRRALIALIALSVSAFTFVTAENLPGGMLTLIAPDLGRTTSEIGLLVTAYAAVVVLASVPLAMVTRRLPRRIVLVITTALCVVGSLWSALAAGYWDQMAARVVTALGQALFWAVVIPAAAAMFPPHVRGKMIARLTIGNSLGPMLGVPFGTWLGQQAGWRVSFLVMSAVSLAACLAVAAFMPPAGGTQSDTSRGTHPSMRRFVVLMTVTCLLVTGGFAMITFVTQFLLEVSGFAPQYLSLLLLGQGLAGLVATFVVGQVLDRHPWTTMVIALGLMIVAFTVLQLLGGVPPLAVAGLALFGFAFSAIPPAISHLNLQVAPGGTEMASAVSSSVFNVGIAAGSAIGAGIVASVGVQSIPVVGAFFVLLAGGVLAWELSRSQRVPQPV
ncbi:MFS transporter [Antribacter gilvus]|uniref:MFS transporter n=1 Tax=Antribacter gilvus TaxID=2304675 RepID=UPI000F76F5E3|nr:MFS transporter [Antribacter gilvus]